MTNTKTIQLALASVLFLLTPTMVWASSGKVYDSKNYEEVSYDDLLNELNTKKQKLTTASVEPTRYHAGIGYANSFTNINAGGSSFNRHATGIQLSAGMDLADSQWYTEGIFRNYSSNSTATEDYSLRELELKIGFMNTLASVWNYTIATGLSNRFMSYSDSKAGINVDESTPSLVISTGLMAKVHRNLSLGAEISGRTAMANRAADQNSFDFAFRLNTSL